jgi:hypothetical protein
MNQLQTVLDALEQWIAEDADCDVIEHDRRIKEAIGIIKQMMQAQPVAEVALTARNVGSELKSKWVNVLVSELPPVGTKLYAAPQAVPAHLEEQPDGSVVDTRNAPKGLSTEPLKPTDEELFKIYCLDEDAGDWHTPSNNYYAGFHMGWKLTVPKVEV